MKGKSYSQTRYSTGQKKPNRERVTGTLRERKKERKGNAKGTLKERKGNAKRTQEIKRSIFRGTCSWECVLEVHKIQWNTAKDDA